MNKNGAIGAADLVWDSHAGFAFVQAGDLDELSRWRQSGIDFVSVNVGYDVEPWSRAVEALSGYRHWLRAHPDRFVLAGTVDDVIAAKGSGRLAVAFDIEGADALNGDLGMVDFYYRLGVRQMLLVYNRNNLVGGGCHDGDQGLTPFGRAVIAEMNRVGMIVDASHCSHRTSLDMMECSTAPVVFSHSNARALHDHERNIRDDQIKACAAQGGVIGVNGVGLFLGTSGDPVELLLAHIDHMCQLVGPQHVGLGLDSILACQPDDLLSEEALRERAAAYWPPRQYPAAPMNFAPPEIMTDIAAGLDRRGYAATDIRAILGGNFARIANHVWRPVIH
ncbi:dipeptidase [Dongia sp.]|uniref:dipeptidase n=1 Tax=Dongia sp. TaxID=1977262 RepID=UPI0035B1E8B5